MIAETLESFANATKHKTVDSEAHLLRKLLATQCPRTNWRNVYHHVSDDVDRIEYRAPGALTRYATQPKVPFRFLADVLDGVEMPPTIKHFTETVAPHPALFFCSNLTRGELIAALDDLGASDSYDGLMAYFLTDAKLDETELGNWIADQEFAELPLVVPKGKTEEFVETNDRAPTPPPRAELVFVASEPMQWDERVFRQHPEIKAYKREHDLPTQTRSLGIAKQLPLLDVVDYFTQDDVDAFIGTDQAHTFYVTSGFPTKLTRQAFIKRMLESEQWSPEVALIFNDATTGS